MLSCKQGFRGTSGSSSPTSNLVLDPEMNGCMHDTTFEELLFHIDLLKTIILAALEHTYFEISQDGISRTF